MPPTTPFAGLSAAAFAELQDRADRFADAVQSGPVADWGPYLDGAAATVRVPLLYELIKIDLEAGWRRGAGRVLEDYLTLFPDLGPTGAVPVHVIFEEYRTRTRFGDRPDLAAYRTRFPEQFARLEHLAKEPATWGNRGGDGAEGESRSEPEMAATNLAAVLAPPSGENPADKPVVVKGYELVKWLGGGQFGEVWRAKGPGGVEVAVKIVKVAGGRNVRDPAARELGALELVKNLRHPFLMQTHAFWVEAQKLYIVADLAEGSLRDRLDQCQNAGLPGIPPDELIPLTADAAEGIDFLHSRGVFHRDVKPDNLLLMNGHTKVADFGLAKSLDPGVAVSFAGTPAYMAPEVWANRFVAASDQFALAYSYAEMRQGKRPVGGDNLVEMVRLLREGKYELWGIPEPERSVVRKALAPDAEDRFGSCSEFAAALAAASGTGLRRASAPKSGTLDSAYRAPDPAASADSIEWAASFAPGASAPHGGLNPSASLPVVVRTMDEPPSLLATVFPGPVPGPAVDKGTATEETYADLPPPPEPAPQIAGPKSSRTLLLIGLGVVVFGAVAAVVAVVGGGTKTVAPTAPGTAPATDGGGERPAVPTTPAGETPDLPPKPPAGVAFAAAGPLKRVGGHTLPERLRLPVPGPKPVEFRLIVPGAGGPPPFYVMERKMWNGLVRAVAAFNPSALNDTKWDKNAPPDLPAMGLTFAEATACSKWLGGALPTPDQWDAAAGFYDQSDRAGPPSPAGRAAVGLPAPRSVFENADESPVGVYDTAGNGREWTREVLPDPPVAVVRGRVFTLRTPLSFADLAAERKDPQTQFPGVGSPYTGFRVVVDVP